MKRLILLMLLLETGISQLWATPKATDDKSDLNISASFGEVGFFYNSLSPYGEWIELEVGFHVWRPLNVDEGWRPYLHGRWAWTDYGWYWVSSEPFGWATYHYGRWFYDDSYGWVWMPDRVWGPAWVEWRYNDDFLGWSPLPPYASFSFGVGIRFTTRWFAPMHYWSFVPYHRFTSPYIFRDVMPVEYTRRLIGTTRSGGRYEVEGTRIINRGIEREMIERRGGYTRINRVDVTERGERGERFLRSRNQERIEVYRPSVSVLNHVPERIEARRAERRTSLDLEQIERPRRDASENIIRENNAREQTRSNGAIRTPAEVRQDNTQPRQQQAIEQPREQQRRELFQPRSITPRQFEKRFEQRSRVQEIEKKIEQRETFRERTPRGERTEITPPRFKMEQPRVAPERKENPRGSEQRQGGTRRGKN